MHKIYTSLEEMAVCFWRLGASWRDPLGDENYADNGKIAIGNQCRKDTINNILRVLPEEDLFIEWRDS